MPRSPDPDKHPMTDADKSDRIAKVLARAGVASRREAEAMIAAGRVSVNGRVLDSPALNVGPRDRITVDGQPLAAAEPPRLWLYHKPAGLVTSARDEKGRETIFDRLPEELPRVMSVGRLDLNSEGLLLLTNDGELKRRLELPSTGWLRKYRVRVHGTPTPDQLAPLKAGITIDGERFQPMLVSIDRQQGANAWLTIGLREGKNREIRRAMEFVGLVVNRLIRVGYGPFQLGDLEPGAVSEVRQKVLREQLGLEAAPQQRPAQGGRPAAAKPAGAKPAKTADAATPEAKRFKSWGMKSRGSTRATLDDDGSGAPRPRSWGSKSAGARQDAPRKGAAPRTATPVDTPPSRAPRPSGSPQRPDAPSRGAAGPAPRTGPTRQAPTRQNPAPKGPAKGPTRPGKPRPRG